MPRSKWIPMWALSAALPKDSEQLSLLLIRCFLRRCINYSLSCGMPLEKLMIMMIWKPQILPILWILFWTGALVHEFNFIRNVRLFYYATTGSPPHSEVLVSLTSRISRSDIGLWGWKCFRSWVDELNHCSRTIGCFTSTAVGVVPGGFPGD